MRHIISALFLCIFATLALAAQPLQLADGAPERYTVAPGDTLWGLAARYLKDPYRWPELWKMNARDVKNPHRIYPGQILVLDRSGPEPRLALATVKEQPQERIEALRQAIPSIPARDIEPFLSQPLVVDKAAIDAAVRIVGLQDNRVIAGAGDTVYTTPADAAQTQWQVFRRGKPLVDPDTGEVLGHEAIFLGTARLTAPGDVASFVLLTSKEEVAAGDFLLPAPKSDVLRYLPHAPERAVKGRVLSMYGAVGFGGPQNIAVINRGQKDGLELGHVLAVDKAGGTVDDRFQGEKKTYALPDARNGLMFVFRVMDRVAYALIMNARQPVEIGDSVRTP
jgi:nucleoid-associated protein YgaU